MTIQKDHPLYHLWTRYKFVPLPWKMLPIVLLMATVFILDQEWLPSPLPPEILHRLYYLPIVLSGLLFGFRGGLASALVVTLLFIPHWIGIFETGPSHKGFIDEIILFYAFGILIGLLVDRERMESQRRMDQEHLAIMGEAAATVAHELKNPIITIGAYLQKIKQRIGPDDPIRERLDIVLQECRRVEVLLKDMIHFSRPIDLRFSSLDINQVVREVVELIQPQAEKRQVWLSSNLDGNLPPLTVDQTRLTQVLYNLILNAIQASNPDQSVLVQTFRQKNQVLIEVTDSGAGIPSECRDKIFNPFFSTKKEGTGMGLAISKRIVELHQGRLVFRPNQPQGTIFIVSLPCGKKIPSASAGREKDLT
jgi:signal transduction histidine kinase